MVQEQRTTSCSAAKINLSVDYSGKQLKTGQNDVVFIYADITDINETVVYDAKHTIEFKVISVMRRLLVKIQELQKQGLL